MIHTRFVAQQYTYLKFKLSNVAIIYHFIMRVTDRVVHS